MKEIFDKIWDTALKYQDKRNDIGHAVVSLDYAFRLIETEGGNEDVIIPAIILHDVGWSQLPDDERMQVFNPDASDEARKRVVSLHQKMGAELAQKILKEVNYPAELIPEIVEIISQHDTREGFLSKNDGLVRDADKLWRVSKVGRGVAGRREKPGDRDKRRRRPRPMPKPEDKEKAKEEKKKPRERGEYYYSAAAKRFDREEMAARRREQGVGKTKSIRSPGARRQWLGLPG